MSDPQPLYPDTYYHIFNRGVNGEVLFREERNYRYFMRLYARYIDPIAETYAYCLPGNHFHFLLHTKPQEELVAAGKARLPLSRYFNNFFIAYAMAINKAYGRTGPVFESPFERRIVDNDRYFTALVIYIHRNPQHHGLTADFRTWPYSSYHAHLSTQKTRLQREAVLQWFGGRDGFIASHLQPKAVDGFEAVLMPDP